MKRYIVILLLIGLTTYVNGQNDIPFYPGETTIIVSYLPAVTLGESADYTNNFSPRGVDFEVNTMVREDLSVGFVIGWNVFREKLSVDSYEVRDALVTGTQFRYLNTSPINVNVKKYFAGGDKTPYVGFGLGTSYAKKRTDMGVFTVTDEQWQFNLAPEVGILFDVNRRNVLALKVKYNWSADANDFGATSYLSFGIGLGFD